MSSNVVVCQVDPELQSQLTSFRSRKEKVASALVMKVDKETQTVVLDELLEDLESLEELRDSLPDHQPRFIVYTCCLSHSDGRSSFPMCFIFFSPRDCKPEMQMMYAGSKLELVNKVILSHLHPCAPAIILLMFRSTSSTCSRCESWRRSRRSGCTPSWEKIETGAAVNGQKTYCILYLYLLYYILYTFSILTVLYLLSYICVRVAMFVPADRTLPP